MLCGYHIYCKALKAAFGRDGECLKQVYNVNGVLTPKMYNGVYLS